MARMYSRAKGRSGSTRPSIARLPAWLRYSPKEIELLVAKLAKEEGLKPSQIGLRLRDVYGVPDITLATKKSVTAILAERGLATKLPEDLIALLRKSIKLRQHLESHRKDKHAKRGLLLTESKIRRLTKYYSRTGKLLAGWVYDPATAKFYIE